MHATIGDTLHIRACHTDAPDQWGKIIEIRGTGGDPPYLIEFSDGHVGLVFPGPDAVIESTKPGVTPLHNVVNHRRLHAHHGW